MDTNAHFSGLERCASIWACPVCSAVIRAERATDIQSAVEKWQTDENHLVFVTLTMRHKRTDKLAVTLNAALKAWSKVTSGRAWVNFKNQFGVQGFVRAVEVTLGENGWHPHIHALLFTNKPMTADDQEALSSALFDRWVKYVTSLGGGIPSKLRGIDVRPATKDGKVVAQYLSKVQEKNLKPDQGIGKEMARFDFKTGRGLSMTPFELLDGSDNDENFIIMKLWNEYVAATKGRRAITWSQGLRDLVA
ncbi:protein rep, partial [Arthrobacter sp. B1805]